jgi:hypothetical protein
MLTTGQIARCVRYNGRNVARTLHTSTVRLDLFSFFRKTKVPEERALVKPQKTSEVMKQLADDTKQSERPKLRMLGTPPVDNSWELENRGFAVNPWPVRTVAPNLTLEKVEEALRNAYETVIGGKADANIGEISLLNLRTRFDFIKHVNKVLKVAIPDVEISKMSSIADVGQYYTKRVINREFNEWEPEAIYLKPEDFEGYNVTIVDAQAERAKIRDKRKSLLQAARKAEHDTQRKLLEKAFE